MSSPKAPSAGESTEQALGSVIKYLPAYQEILNKNLLPTAEAEQNVAETISPRYQQLLTNLYKEFAPQLAQIGNDIESSSRLKGAETDAKILKDHGKDITREYDSLNRELNPEYYNVRSQTGSSLAELLRGINLDNPDIEAERLINQENERSGTANVPSATNTLANALSFGQAKNNRMAVLGNAIAQANAFLPNANNQSFNPATTLLNRPTSNAGQNQFAGVQQGAGSSANSAGQGLFNNVSGFQQQAMQINSNRRDVLDRLNEVTSSV